MNKKKKSLKIVLTGGGTAGHIMPHIALLPMMKKKNWKILYIGGAGLEKEIIKKTGLSYKQISTGKLRRYFSIDNFIDIFKVTIGFFQSIYYLYFFKPQLVFSKGGFVSVPVCFAAKVLDIPIITHESDLTPGLANKLIAKVSKVIFYAFTDTKKYLSSKIKSYCVGIPVRNDLLSGDRVIGLEICSFVEEKQKPVLLILGGSLGAQSINALIYSCLDDLLKNFNVIHITGKGKSQKIKKIGYKSFEFIEGEFKDILACSDLVVSRAGANSLFELLAAEKPMLLIPLLKGSRGDQVDNALNFQKNGWAEILEEKNLKASVFLEACYNLNKRKEKLRSNLKKQNISIYSHDQIISLIEENIE